MQKVMGCHVAFNGKATEVNLEKHMYILLWLFTLALQHGVWIDRILEVIPIINFKFYQTAETKKNFQGI